MNKPIRLMELVCSYLYKFGIEAGEVRVDMTVDGEYQLDILKRTSYL
jgi:hypothetical protein